MQTNANRKQAGTVRKRLAAVTTIASCVLIGMVFFAAAGCGPGVLALVDALPELTVRVVNETGVNASVVFETGIPFPESDLGLPFGPPAGSLFAVGPETVVVLAGGTVTGTIKCGEVIGITATAPPEADTQFESIEAFGLCVFPSGNIEFSGVGASSGSGSDFTGDVATTGLGRFVRPTVDGLDCAAGTLVVRILTPGSAGVVDTETGDVVGAINGTGTVEIE